MTNDDAGKNATAKNGHTHTHIEKKKKKKMVSEKRKLKNSSDIQSSIIRPFIHGR